MRLPSLLAISLLIGAPSLATAQTGIEHDPVACVIAGRFPRMSACLPEPDEVRNARVYFRAEGTATWYHVIMSRDAACFSAALPKPKRDLLGRSVEYYVEADHRRLGSPRTPEYQALVVQEEGSCKGFVAKLASAAPKAVFPALPAGFAAGGASVGTAAIVGAGAAAAGGAAVAVGAAGGGEPTPDTTAPSATEPTATTTRPSSTTPTQGPTALALECSATPDSGPLPLTVRFDAGATGVSVNPSFVWDFGDGAGAVGSVAQHVYSAAGRYTATVTGTAGAASGTCTRQIAAAVAPVATGRLSVKVAGNGAGSVRSSPAGIDCRAACSAPFALGSEVALEASPQSDSKFTGWSGPCAGAGTVSSAGGACVVKITDDVAVEAAFERLVGEPVPTFQLTVTRQGTSGTVVRSSPPGIDCGGDCTERYPSGTPVSLGLVGASIADFKEWAGDCSGSGACSFVMDRDRNVTASFSDPPTPTTTTTTTTTTMAPAPVALTVQLQGAGTGTVTGAGINCPGTCTAGQAAGSIVTIHAQAGPSSVFSGWTGDCSGQSDNCTLTMSGARTARARFDALFRLDVSIQGTGRVRSDSQINCPGVCSETRVDGAVITLLGQITTGGAFQGWEGPCVSDATPETCKVTMSQNRAVVAKFGGIIPLTTPAVRWRSVLDAPGARGTLRAGSQTIAVEPGERLLELPGAEETVIEASVTGPRGGTWRFEAADEGAVEPGSLRVIAGEALSVGPASIAFRTGRETRVVFAFRTRARP
jgi:PKD repeat protein